MCRHAREVSREFLVKDDGFLGGRRVQQSQHTSLVPVAEPRVRAIETVDRRGDADDITVIKSGWAAATFSLGTYCISRALILASTRAIFETRAGFAVSCR